MTEPALRNGGSATRTSSARIGLHLDGIAVLAASITGYAMSDGKWWLFVVLLFAPDVFMLGYLVSKPVGALVYNIGHTYLVPGALLAVGLASGVPLITQIGLIWVAHIAFDRAVGYGFKYSDAFESTHYKRV